MGKDSVGNIPFVEYNRHRQKNSYKEKEKKLYLVENETTEKNIERLIHYIAQQKKSPKNYPSHAVSIINDLR